MYHTADNVRLQLSGATKNWVATTGAGTVRTGTSANDLFHSLSGDLLVGGKGDDIYYLWDSGSTILEGRDGGVDTAYVAYWGGAVLAANVENLILYSAGATWGTGNALGNIIIAGKAGALLDGAGGDDVLVGGSGADIFQITAGNGSDAIYNFRPGWDAITLKGYGFASFDDILAHAVQAGKDVRIELGNGEKLVIRDVLVSDLSSADFGFTVATKIPLPGAEDRGDRQMMTDAQAAWNSHGWYVHNNAYDLSGLTYGKDAWVKSGFKLSDMTDGTTFSWSFPLTNALYPTVRAYPEVIFGLSPLNPERVNPTDTAFVLPVRIASLEGLTATHDLSYAGNLAGFNVAYDIWLTSVAGGDKSTITGEVMIWVHEGSFDAYGQAVGSYIAGDGATATIYHTGTYTAVVFDKDIPRGTIDIADILSVLADKGYVDPASYVASIELGAEVVSGSGSLVINDLELNVVTRTDTGEIVTKHVTGSGTEVEVTPVAEVPLYESPYTPGTETLVDVLGNATGSRTTRLNEDGTVTIEVKDGVGKLVSSETAALERDRVTVSTHDGAGNLIATDVTIYEGAGTVVSQHFSASGILLSAARSVTGADGWTTTERYDGDFRVTAIERSTAHDGGGITQYYDAYMGLVRAEQVETLANGSVRTQHYGADLSFRGADVTTEKPGSIVTVHYDASWKVTGTDKIAQSSSGLVTQHYDAANKLQSIDYSWANPNGCVNYIHADANWNSLIVDRHGTDGNDSLSGNFAQTIFHGGLGSDRIYCGDGIDIIHFDSSLAQGDVDIVSKFSAGTDKFMLDRQIFGEIAELGVLSASAFVSGKAALDADDRLIYDQQSGSLWYDSDGNGSAAAIKFAQLSVLGSLSAHDFIVY